MVYCGLDSLYMFNFLGLRWRVLTSLMSQCPSLGGASEEVFRSGRGVHILNLRQEKASRHLCPFGFLIVDSVSHHFLKCLYWEKAMELTSIKKPAEFPMKIRIDLYRVLDMIGYRGAILCQSRNIGSWSIGSFPSLVFDLGHGEFLSFGGGLGGVPWLGDCC